MTPNLIENVSTTQKIRDIIPNKTRTTRYWKKTSDKRRYTTIKELAIKFHDRPAEANTNFYI